jgi:CheY-like chemotaxis protein
VRLPLVQPRRLASAQPEAARVGPARRFLVADDNADAAASLATLLTLSGHEVRTAHDGRSAVDAAREYRPEVALLDIGMPELSGYEVARSIRAENWGKDMKLIALTGWGQAEDRDASRAAGFDHHLVKPITLETLMTLLAAD